jgi:hypothetical protein
LDFEYRMAKPEWRVLDDPGAAAAGRLDPAARQITVTDGQVARAVIRAPDHPPIPERLLATGGPIRYRTFRVVFVVRDPDDDSFILEANQWEGERERGCDPPGLRVYDDGNSEWRRAPEPTAHSTSSGWSARGRGRGWRGPGRS